MNVYLVADEDGNGVFISAPNYHCAALEWVRVQSAGEPSQEWTEDEIASIARLGELENWQEARLVEPTPSLEAPFPP